MQNVGPIILTVLFVLSLSIGQTLFSSIYLFKKAITDKRTENLFLAFFTLLLSAIISTVYLLDFWVLSVPHVILTYVPVLPAIPVTLYFYTRKVANSNYKISLVSAALHFSPVVFIFFSLLPFYTLSGMEKLEWYFYRYQAIVHMTSISDYTKTLFSPLILLISAHGIIYLLSIFHIIRSHKKTIVETYSYLNGVDLAWLKYVTVACLIVYIAFPIITFIPLGIIHPMYAWIANIIVFCSFISVFSYFGISQQKIIVESELSNGIGTIEPVTNTPPTDKSEKYRNSNLNNVNIELIRRSLDDAITKNKVHQNPKLTIGELAQQLKLPTRDLSRVINEQYEKKFLEFINYYRVLDAKQLLTSEDTQTFTILDIAYEVGFNSKTTFYDAFKRETGKTPTQYRKALIH